MSKINFLFFCILISLLTACSEVSKVRVLPILGERDIEYKLVNGEEVIDTIYHKVPSFRYLNQDSVWVNAKELNGKVWITDFFFSYCPSICPPMTSNMKRLNINTEDLKENIQFLSFSIDPERDSPSRLRQYIKDYGITANNWFFLTGQPENNTHNLAKDFFNGAERDASIEGGFGHTSHFAIVDHEGYVRGIYDGTNATQVDLLEKDLRKLLKYEYDVD